MLLDDYGRWARGSGIAGYPTGHHREGPQFIDDESAIEIDRALVGFKRNKPKVYRVLYMYYVLKLSTIDIAAALNRHCREYRRERLAVEQTEAAYAVRQFGQATKYRADGEAVRYVIDYYTDKLREVLSA